MKAMATIAPTKHDCNFPLAAYKYHRFNLVECPRSASNLLSHHKHFACTVSKFYWRGKGKSRNKVSTQTNIYFYTVI